MSQTNVQFSVALHAMTSLGVLYGKSIRSSDLAGSINADPSFVRRVISKLAKAGLVSTTRGKSGACTLARLPADITLLDIYNASEAPKAFTVHCYPVTEGCHVSRNIKGCLGTVLQRAQDAFELGLKQQTLADVIDAVENVT